MPTKNLSEYSLIRRYVRKRNNYLCGWESFNVPTHVYVSNFIAVILYMRVCVRVCLHICGKSGLCACSVRAKGGHTPCPLLVLASILDSSSLKTLESTLKLCTGVACLCSRHHWNYFWDHLYINKSPLSVKTSYSPVHTSHAKCWSFKCWCSALFSKAFEKIRVYSWWRSYV